VTRLAKDRSSSRGAWTRRAFVKTAAAAVAAPWVVRTARAASGEVSWLTWDDYAPQPLVERFERDTGIKLKITSYPTNEDLLNRLKESKGEGFDLCSPTVTWVPALVQDNLLLALDEAKLTSQKNVMPSIQDHASNYGAMIDGKRYACPYDWGTEALAYDNKQVSLEYGKASFGDLWNSDYKGKVACRLTSMMLGTGLWMERQGELPEGVMRKAYDEEPAFDQGYGKAAQFVASHKDQIGAQWQGTIDTQEAFAQKGCIIGQTWDGPILQMKNEGKPYSYLAPVEGALAWLDTIAVPAGAKNVEQAYAFINWSLQAEIGGIVSDNTGYNSVVAGFADHVHESFKKNFNEAYPGDAIQRLWFKGIEQPWFIKRLQDYVARIAAT
jgi:spermidine/putrescine transport system substrate-binding protein